MGIGSGRSIAPVAYRINKIITGEKINEIQQNKGNQMDGHDRQLRGMRSLSGMKGFSPEFGYWNGNIPYARIGTGERHIIYLNGGPGNDVPRGLMLRMYLGDFTELMGDYTIWVVTRRQGQPGDYGTRQMAADLARGIGDFFPDPPDAVIALSFGGMVAQYLAADFPGLVKKYILLDTGYILSPRVGKLDMKFARHMAVGRSGRALAQVALYTIHPGPLQFLAWLFFLLFGNLIMGNKHHSHFESDVINEARAGMEHDSRDVLSLIREPVLLCGGGRDIAFPPKILEETALGIERADLIIFPGRAHSQTMGDRKFLPLMTRFLSV